MLRITVHDDPEVVRLQVEGHVADPWLQALQDCWHSIVTRRPKPVLWVDLTSAILIDLAGKAFLAQMQRDGANFIAIDCMTKSIVAELPQCSAQAPDCQDDESA